MRRTPKQDHLRQLVKGKQQWSEPLAQEDLAAGFLGWHERGYLPHCDRPGLVQFVTFRLHDSMPASKRSEWEFLLSIEDDSLKRRKTEEYLDLGVGSCHLRDHRIAALVEKSLLHHHEKRFQLLAWIVMPNHVHVLVQLYRVPLSKIIQNWKSVSAVAANRVLNRKDRFWQPEYWDRFMRNEEQTRKAIRYIENNPVKANLCRAPDDWPFSSARFRHPQTRELVLPRQT